RGGLWLFLLLCAIYTANGHNRSFLLCFFHHEAHEEHKGIIKSINSNLDGIVKSHTLSHCEECNDEAI
ncbi:MAG: hypothetical protein KAU60_08490, partial [Desulfobacterales bacterium]|nr:hypothetical protein [Desulfobacterales bacterium]